MPWRREAPVRRGGATVDGAGAAVDGAGALRRRDNGTVAGGLPLDAAEEWPQALL